MIIFGLNGSQFVAIFVPVDLSWLVSFEGCEEGGRFAT